MRSRSSALVPAGAALLALTACKSPDPDTRFDDYIRNVENLQDTGTADTNPPPTDVLPSDTGDVSTDADAFECPILPFDPSGDWYLIVSATLDRERPFYLRTTFVEDDDGTFTATFQPLKTDEIVDTDSGARTPRDDRRTPTGDPIVVSGVDLSGDTFQVAVDDLVLDDEANPVTGRRVLGDVTLEGAFRDYTTSCGDVGGAIVEPLSLPLGGSTFTLFRSDDFNAETTIPINCDQLPAPQPPPREDCEAPVPVDPCGDFTPEGTYLLAVSATLDRERPLLLELDLVPNGDNWDFIFQPLATDEVVDPDSGSRAPRDNPRVPVGDPISSLGVPVDPTSGDFTVTVENLTVNDDANPITGRRIRGDVTLTGSFRSDDWVCGDVTGTIVEPLTLPLGGSTFAFLRTDDPLSVDPIVYQCADVPSNLECTVPR